jgi:DNA-binding response OmpR family regulator
MEPGITSRKRALVVDDEPVIARIFRKILAEDGFDVAVAADGNLARDMVRREAFDLCILNIHVPGISGIELYQVIKEERPELSARTLFATGDILNGSTQTFLKEANRPVLLKPFTPDELRAAVRDAMHRDAS